MGMKRNVVDTHIHYWDPAVLTYSWLADVPDIAQAHGPRELQAQESLTERFVLDQIVFMQADTDDAEVVQEAAWVNRLAESIEPRITGIIACAPLEQDAAAALEALQALPRVKGIRRLIQDQPTGYAVAPRFVEGVRSLPAYGFSFDLCIRHGQLPETIELVQACPDVNFILDHIGKPDIKAQQFEPWRTGIRTLAQHPNVVCKLSGMVTEADLDHWTLGDLQPYVDHVIEAFGVDRVLYGGDWPVSLLGVQHWGQWVDALDDLTAALSPEEKQKLFHDNAVRVYRL